MSLTLSCRQSKESISRLTVVSNVAAILTKLSRERKDCEYTDNEVRKTKQSTWPRMKTEGTWSSNEVTLPNRGK